MIQLTKKTKSIFKIKILFFQILESSQKSMESPTARWILSFAITLAFLAVFIFISNLNTIKFSGGQKIESQENVSLVRIIKKAPPKKIEIPANQIQEIQRKQKNVIAAPNAKLVEEEQEIQQIQEIPQENLDELLPNDFPEDVSRAETFDPNAIYDPFAENEIDGDSKDGSSEIQKAKETYKAYVKKRIAAKKIYPLKARAQGQTGNVKIQLVILPDGNLESAEIVQKSEYELLNDAALLAVKKAAPFKKMTDKMQKQEYTFTLEFTLE